MSERTNFEIEETSDLWKHEISPLQKLNSEVMAHAGLEVYVKRDDLLTPYGGNKWRKLKYNFLRMQEERKKEFITFGGPFSNHVYASATLAKLHGLNATIIIRGQVDDLRNPVLQHVRDCGVTVVGLNRNAYADRYSQEFQTELVEKYPDAFIIPEGGANAYGLRGCGEIVDETVQQLGHRPDIWVVAAGTGNTASGLAGRLEEGECVIAIAALRAAIMQSAWDASLKMISGAARHRLTFFDAFNFGGMAKWNDELILFMKQFEADHDIQLDPIYTGKAMYGLFGLVEQGEFKKGTTIVFVHTGGMPGRMSFNYRFGGIL